MKKVFSGVFILGVLVMVGGFVTALQSETAPTLGLVGGHLRPCPEKPNCVCSESSPDDKVHAIAPFSTSNWLGLRLAIAAAGGRIDKDNGAYLHATFTSRVFRYVDDLELRRDDAHGVIQVRSSSRVGYSGFGVNRKRVEAIRARLEP